MADLWDGHPEETGGWVGRSVALGDMIERSLSAFAERWEGCTCGQTANGKVFSRNGEGLKEVLHRLEKPGDQAGSVREGFLERGSRQHLPFTIEAWLWTSETNLGTGCVLY